MQKIFADTRKLDEAARCRYSLTEAVMMENAAAALESETISYLDACSVPNPVVLIVAGTGNNGGDGYALARRLYRKSISDGRKIDILLFAPNPPKTETAISQKESAVKAGVAFVNTIQDQKADVLVDCFLGSGFSGVLSESAKELIIQMNAIKAFKIACDVPSGLSEESDNFFIADKTVTMGALKTQLFCENGKDSTGSVNCVDLGVSRFLFDNSDESIEPEAYLLDKNDLCLPHRIRNNVNKGTFGTLAVFAGEKHGAAVIASKAAFSFGCGLVSLISPDFNKDSYGLPEEIVYSVSVPKNATAIAAGMGLGSLCDSTLYYLIQNPQIPCVIDADLCHNTKLPELLSSRDKKTNIVLTPHPKEFAHILEICGFGNFTVNQIEKERINLAKQFCEKYHNAVLVLKGNVPIIAAFNGDYPVAYLNPWGKPCLAKAGSGDVLSGLIGALLAQGYDAFSAAMNGSLAHSLASCKVECDYAMTPQELIECVKKL